MKQLIHLPMKFLLVFLAGTFHFQTISPALSETTFSKTEVEMFATPEFSAIDDVVKAEMALQEIVGCAVGVVQNGVITHVKGYGYLDLEQKKPVSNSTVFRWASISKTITATAVLKAIEDGKFNLDDKVKDIVSYWPTSGSKDKITVRHLLNNRSGITHYGLDENDSSICTTNSSAYTANNNFNAEQSVNVFKDCKLLATPGTKYRYSTFGFNLLSAVVEKGTGKAFEKYVDENIANKVGMNSLTAYAKDPGGFEKDCNDKLKFVKEGDNVEWKLGGGGWSSNIYDMTRFMEGLIDGKFLKNTSALWQSVPGNTSYCFGMISQPTQGKVHVYHNGAHDDVRTYLGFFPNDKNGICLIINGGKYVDETRFLRKLQNAIGYKWTVSDLPVDYCGSKTECGETVTGVWRKTNVNDVLIRRGYEHDEFYEVYKDLRNAGYYCANFETYTEGGKRKWDGIFKPGKMGAAMWRNFDNDAFKEKWDEMNNDGYRLIDIETYEEGNKRKWAGLFIKASGPYAMWRGQTTNEFGEKNKEMEAKGLMLVDVEPYQDGGKVLWAGVWRDKGNYLLNRNYDTDDFRDLRRTRNAAGWKLIDVETYMDGGKRKWAGVWEKSEQAEKFLYGFKFCNWLGEHEAYKKEGYELVNLERY